MNWDEFQADWVPLLKVGIRDLGGAVRAFHEAGTQLFDDEDDARAFAESVLLFALRNHDIKWLPDDIEEAVEKHLVSIVVGLILSLDFHADPAKRAYRKMRRAERRIAKGKMSEGTYWDEARGVYVSPGDPAWNQAAHDKAWSDYAAERAR